MKGKWSMARSSILLGIVCFCLVPALSAQSANVTVFATGLNNPRGLKFGPHGNLYVAEGGAGGTLSTTIEQCEQAAGLPAGPGPYTGGFSARISKINRHGVRTTVVDGLPSSQTRPDIGSLTSGVADVAFLDDTLYALIAGAGCSHGLAGTSNGVIRVKHGHWKQIANLSKFQMAHPVVNPEPDDFEPDGTWYSMIAVNGGLFAVEPNHGELDLITRNGKIHRVADISATQGHIVPTAIAFRKGNFYVGNLNTFPIVDGSSKILRITPWGKVTTVATGFTTILGLAFDRRGRLYVLENTTGNPLPTPGTGKVVRLEHSGEVTEIATGLSVPTAMTFGPNGKLYVSNVGFGAPPLGLGEVVKIAVPDNDGDDDEDRD